MRIKPLNTLMIEARLPGLLRGEILAFGSGGRHVTTSQAAGWICVIMMGSASYGAAMGWWQAPLQAFYAGIKFPLVILLTTLGNALLNSMLAPLLGVDMSLRQSFAAVLMSFTIAAAILASLSPLLGFVVWNTPPVGGGLNGSFLAYQILQLCVVVGIAFAGVVANVRLLPVLRSRASTDKAAKRVLFAWLAANLFLGSQICWLLRPFIGRPQDAVAFLGPEPFHGSFYLTVFDAIRALFTGETTIRS